MQQREWRRNERRQLEEAVWRHARDHGRRVVFRELGRSSEVEEV
jgi:hypothetical protein